MIRLTLLFFCVVLTGSVAVGQGRDGLVVKDVRIDQIGNVVFSFEGPNGMMSRNVVPGTTTYAKLEKQFRHELRMDVVEKMEGEKVVSATINGQFPTNASLKGVRFKKHLDRAVNKSENMRSLLIDEIHFDGACTVAFGSEQFKIGETTHKEVYAKEGKPDKKQLPDAVYLKDGFTLTYHFDEEHTVEGKKGKKTYILTGISVK